MTIYTYQDIMLHLVAPCQAISFPHLPNTKLARCLLEIWVKVLVLGLIICPVCHTYF